MPTCISEGKHDLTFLLPIIAQLRFLLDSFSKNEAAPTSQTGKPVHISTGLLKQVQ